MRVLILLSLLLATPAWAGWSGTPNGTDTVGKFKQGNRYYHRFTSATDSSLGDTNECASSHGQYKDESGAGYTVNFQTCEAPDAGVNCDSITAAALSDGEGFIIPGPMGSVRCSPVSGSGVGMCTFYCGN